MYSSLLLAMKLLQIGLQEVFAMGKRFVQTSKVMQNYALLHHALNKFKLVLTPRRF